MGIEALYGDLNRESRILTTQVMSSLGGILSTPKIYESPTMQLELPHIPLGISLDDGIQILNLLSHKIEKLTEGESEFYKVCCQDSEFGFYAEDGLIHSTLYNDPIGRESNEGIETKIATYLARYGNIDDWEEGINNGWIQFFINTKEGISMAYGLHKDVLRFNKSRN